MSGLSKGGNQVYLSVSNGQLVRSFKSPTKETVERINKTGKTVYEEFFKDLTGVVTDVSTKDGTYGPQLLISVLAGDEVFQIQLQLSSRYSSSFLKILPNADLSKEITIRPWQMPDSKDASKTISGITLYQGGKLAPAFTREDPKGLPEMEKIQQKVKGKLTTTWDDTEMLNFLVKNVRTLFKGKPVEKKQAESKDPLAEAFDKKDGFTPVVPDGEKAPF